MPSSLGRPAVLVLAAAVAAFAVGLGSPVSASAEPDADPGSTTSTRTVASNEPGSTGWPGSGLGTSSAGGPSTGAVTQSLVRGMPGNRPNIVVFMADDMREDELAFMPNVRRSIEARGVRFVNSFSPYPLCCPARASFVTGQYTHNHGVWTNAEPYGFGALDDSSTVATDLATAGYRTAFLGKYLNGYGTTPAPDGSTEDSHRYIPPGWHDWRGSVNDVYGLGTPEAGGTYSYFDTTLNVNGRLEGHQGKYQTRMFGDETEDMVEGLSRSTRPFFLWASYVAPHAGGPVESDDPRSVLRSNGNERQVISPARPRDVKGMFDEQIPRSFGAVPEPDNDDKARFMRNWPTLNDAEVAALTEVSRQRAESLFVVDQEIGRTLEVLERTGELDNTVLVFTSDNGFFLGEHGMLQGKRLPYESGIRVPTVMAGPGIPAGERRHDPFLVTDFAPTFLELAGARTRRTMDGVSMAGVARDGDRGWSRPVFTESGPRRMGGGRTPALEVYPEGPSSRRFSQGVRTPRYLYVEHATDEVELYDLRTDPLQLTSIAGRPRAATVVSRLARVLDRLRTCRGDRCAVPMPPSLRAD